MSSKILKIFISTNIMIVCMALKPSAYSGIDLGSINSSNNIMGIHTYNLHNTNIGEEEMMRQSFAQKSMKTANEDGVYASDVIAPVSDTLSSGYDSYDMRDGYGSLWLYSNELSNPVIDRLDVNTMRPDIRVGIDENTLNGDFTMW